MKKLRTIAPAALAHVRGGVDNSTPSAATSPVWQTPPSGGASSALTTADPLALSPLPPVTIHTGSTPTGAPTGNSTGQATASPLSTPAPLSVGSAVSTPPPKTNLVGAPSADSAEAVRLSQIAERKSGLAKLSAGKGVSGTSAETTKTKTDLSASLLATGRATAGGTATWENTMGPAAPPSADAPITAAGKVLTVTGGPDEVLHEQGAQGVLSGMERGTNQNKVHESLMRKSETDHAASVVAAKKAKTAAPAAFNPKATADKHWDDLSGGVDPEAIASGAGVASYPAHFLGRHGAGEAASDASGVAASKEDARVSQMARVAAGYEPDLQGAATKDSAKPTAALTHDGDALAMPSFTKFGEDAGVASGGFSSHSAQLFAIEEGLSAAWNRGPTVASHSMADTYKTKTESQTQVPSPNPKAPKGTMVSKTVTTEGTETGNFDIDSSRRTVDVSLPKNKKGASPFEGGFGESFTLDKAKYTGPAMAAGDALTPDIMQQRLDATDAVSDQQGAKVILDEDKKRGGFTVQTAYPQNLPGGGANTSSEVTGNFGGKVPKEKKTNLKGDVTWGAPVKKLEADVPLPAVGGSGLDDEAQLAASLARIPTK